MNAPLEPIDYNRPTGDEIKTTTCYMCACRCGIRVHLKDGRVRYIDGNPDHPVNGGVLCGKGAAGIMQHYSPARLTKPLRRKGARGAGEFEEIEWDEALTMATSWLSEVRNTDPRRLAFFTGRDQSQSLTGFWATQFGTPNHAAHGGFCSVNMAAGGIYSIGGSFWEFGEPDWEHARMLLMFGVAEDHDSNPIKIGLGKLKARGAKVVSVNPVRTGYSAIADEWVGIRPGTDGALVSALIHELLRQDRIDLEFLARTTDASWLINQNPGAADHGLVIKDADGAPLGWDSAADAPTPARAPGANLSLIGERTLPDGRKAKSVFQLLAERFLDGANSPEAAAAITDVSAETIRNLANDLAAAALDDPMEIPQPWTDWTGKRHETMVARPVAIHAMRGISAHSNGFDTCRLIHVLQMLLGAIDAPGSFRYKPPFPKPVPPGPKPAGKADQIGPGRPMAGPPLGFVAGPEDLLVDPDGTPRRIDHAYSWEAPVAAHGLMHMVIENAAKQDPNPIDVLFMYMANMGWNSSMSVENALKGLTAKDEETGEYKIKHVIYSDAFWSETVAYADLIFPDTTYLERWDAISLLDRPISDADGPADAIRQPIFEPDRDVRPFQEVVIDLGHRLGLPAFTNEDGTAKFPGGYKDYLVNHERTPGVGPLAGWRGEDGDKGGVGAKNPDQLDKYIENGCFWRHELEPEQRYFKHSNKSYLEWSASMGFIPNADPIVMHLYSEPLQKFRLAAEGHGDIQPPTDAARQRVLKNFDPIASWRPPLNGLEDADNAFPLHAITQRPMAMYHSWGSQNAWLRQIHTANRLFMARELVEEMGLKDDSWVYVTSPNGKIKAQIKAMEGVNPRTVWTWNAIGKRKGAWGLDKDAPEATKGFLLNHLISELLPDGQGGHWPNADPVTGQAAWYDLRVNIEPAPADTAQVSEPVIPALPNNPGGKPNPSRLGFGAAFRGRKETRS